MHDNGVNRLSAFPQGIAIEVTREAATVAWLAMQAKGKLKGRDLAVASRIREAILSEQTVHEDGCATCSAKPGNVEWQAGTFTFTEADFETFAKAVAKLHDDDGVDFGLTTGLLTLHAATEERLDQIKAARKAPPVPANASPT